MPVAPAPPRALGLTREAYAGDNICVLFDGRYLWLKTALGNISMSMTTLSAINQYASAFGFGGSSASIAEQHNVYCEETKKHHRAVLLRELTLDEIYKGLK